MKLPFPRQLHSLTRSQSDVNMPNHLAQTFAICFAEHAPVAQLDRATDF
ncbi:MAG: hypothetical protein FD138_1194 [Planctomycetota bacterium]|nr:MAG: hypothetical protein FD138_1194 [Planctomycetota bacterium]